MASRSKLCGHFVLVTGSRKGRRVSGHLGFMRSLATAMSSSSPDWVSSIIWLVRGSGRGWPGRKEVWGCCCCCCWVDGSGFMVAEVDVMDVGSAGGLNQVEGWGSRGMSSPGNLDSWVMR